LGLGLERLRKSARLRFKTSPIDNDAEGYRAMDERRAIKTLLRVCPVTSRANTGSGFATVGRKRDYSIGTFNGFI
jgi:hypothetical protein